MKFKIIAGSALVLSACCSANAGDAASSTLSLVRVYNNGVVLVWAPGTRTGVPSCAATEPSRFAFDSTTLAGKSLLAHVLATYNAGRPLAIRGTGACAVFSDTEDLQFADEAPY